MKEPGRFCPVDYRYPPASLARVPDFAAETLYAVGGLYGNGVHPSPHRPLCGVERDGVFIEALPVPYAQQRWLQEFVADWPPGSPAYVSYFKRLIDGPAFLLHEAATCHASCGAMRHACAP